MPISPPHASSYYIGLMSGTSLDGVDVVLLDFSVIPPRLCASALLTIPAALRATLLTLQHPSENELDCAAQASNQLADLYAQAINQVLQQASLSAKDVAAVGMHGQTIRHQPSLGYSLQIGNAARLTELCKITVVADFRSRDIAAGGQGAPLVPAFHHALFSHHPVDNQQTNAAKHRVVVNIGGIANLTDLSPHSPVRGWDTGPGNILLDGWIQRHRGLAYDAEGSWAAQGKVLSTLLNILLAEPYFAAPPPKSTGRDLFHLAWLDTMINASLIENPAPQDVQATLLEFTAQSLVKDVLAYTPNAQEIYLCGGGTSNHRLIARLAELLAPRQVVSTEALGLHPDWVEAAAFAWLARQCLLGLPGNLPTVTGAAGERILGAIYAA